MAAMFVVPVTGGSLLLAWWFWGRSEGLWVAQIRAHLVAHRFEEAREGIEQWLAVQPRSASAHYFAALVAWKQKRFETIPATLAEARTLGYDGFEIDRLWGLVLADVGKLDQAEPLLRRAWERSKPRADLDVAPALARILMERFETGLAMEVLDRWAREDATDPRPLVWKADLERRVGSGGSVAIDLYRKALDLDPAHDAARLGLAELCYLAGRHAESAAAYADHVARRPDDASGHVGVALNSLALGRETEAVAALDRALVLDPGNTLALRERAGIHLRRGEVEQALDRLDQAVSADPFDPEIRYQRALVRTRLGRIEEAAADRRRSDELRREFARMGEIREALVTNPQDISLRVEAARWMFEHGRIEEGVAWARLILRDQPNHPEASRLLADYHATRGDWALANHYRVHAGTPAPPALPAQPNPSHTP